MSRTRRKKNESFSGNEFTKFDKDKLYSHAHYSLLKNYGYTEVNGILEKKISKREQFVENQRVNTDAGGFWTKASRDYRKFQENLLRTHNSREMNKWLKDQDYEPQFRTHGRRDHRLL